MREFARRYLTEDGEAFKAFTRAVPNEESLDTLFDFQTAAFDEALQFRVFQLNTGVFVSSPLTEVGQSVQITEGRKKQLSCKGIIKEERLRTRHAWQPWGALRGTGGAAGMLSVFEETPLLVWTTTSPAYRSVQGGSGNSEGCPSSKHPSFRTNSENSWEDSPSLCPAHFTEDLPTR